MHKGVLNIQNTILRTGSPTPWVVLPQLPEAKGTISL